MFLLPGCISSVYIMMQNDVGNFLAEVLFTSAVEAFLVQRMKRVYVCLFIFIFVNFYTHTQTEWKIKL